MTTRECCARAMSSNTNPYQAPTIACPSSTDHRRVWIALIPFFIAVPLLVAAIVVLIGSPLSKDASGVAFGTLASLLVFDLTVCTYVLVKWLSTGVPPDLLSELMMTTAEEREFHRNLRNRPQLNENDFFETFYKHSGVPQDVVARLQRLLEDITGYDLAGLHPADNLAYLDGEMDFADVFRRVERDFGIKLDWDEFRRMEVTFDSLLRATLRCTAATCSDTLAQASSSDG